MRSGDVYSKTMGRIRLDVEPMYRGLSRLHVNTGYNDACVWNQNNLSIEELRDLRYLIDRGIAAHEEYERRR